MNVQTQEEQDRERAELIGQAEELSGYLAVVRDDCLNSYFDFFVEFWDIVSTDELVINWHIKKICDKLQEYAERVINGEPAKDLIINIPPGMSKSTMVSVLLQPWIWLHMPSCVVIGSSYGNELSIDHSLRAKAVYKSDRYQMYFGKHFAIKHGRFISLIKDNEKNWINNFGGARIATSTGSGITGKHGHIILRDDSMNPEQAESSAYRTKANRFNDRTLSNRKKDKERVPTITVEQRLHVDDASGHDLAKASKDVEHIKLPAVLNDKTEVLPKEWEQYYVDGLLDPRRLSPKVLEGQEEDLTAYGYAGQYLQEPVPTEGGVIKREWFDVIPANAVPFNPAMVPMKFMIDGAFTEKTKNDPSAQMGYRVHDGKIYCYACTDVRKELNEYLKFIKPWLLEYEYVEGSNVRIEMKSSGPGLKSMMPLQEYGGFNCTEINSLHVSWGKMTRAEYASPTIEAGRFILIAGNWNRKFVDQVSNFPNDTHDDMLDLLCYATLHELSAPNVTVLKSSINLGGRIM